MFSLFSSKKSSASSDNGRLKGNRKKVKISVPSDVYYEVNFNHLFWTDVFKAQVEELRVNWEYSFEDQAVLVRGKSSKRVDKAVELFVKHLKEVQAMLDPTSARVAQDNKATNKPQSAPVIPDDDDEKPLGLKAAAAENTKQKKPVEDEDDDDKPLIHSTVNVPIPVTAKMPAYKKTLMSSVDKRARSTNSVYFQNGAIVKGLTQTQISLLNQATPITMQQRGHTAPAILMQSPLLEMQAQAEQKLKQNAEMWQRTKVVSPPNTPSKPSKLKLVTTASS